MPRQAQAQVDETSALLPKPSPLPHSATVQVNSGIVANGANATVDSERDGGSIERQPSNGESYKHVGMPEVKKQMKYIFPAIAVGVFLAAADITLVVAMYGAIGTELHALSSTSWIATGYFLTLTAFQPLYGKLCDIFGRKSTLLVAYLIFGIGSTCCGLARTIEELVAARAFAGIGGGGMTICTNVIFSDVMSLSERGVWQGYINVIYAFGAAAGASLGGILADSVIGWRWAFLAQGPMALLAFSAVAIALHYPQEDHSHWKEKVMKIDFMGAAILIVACFGLLVGLDRGSNVSWTNPLAIAGLATTPLFVVFVFVEKSYAKHPFAPGHIILSKKLLPCYLCNFFCLSGWFSALFFIPLYWQVIGDFSASKAGILLTPSTICGVTGSLFGGYYMKYTKRYYWLTVVTNINLTIGVAIIFLFAGTISQSLTMMVIGTCICAFSNGLGLTTTLTSIIANAAHADQAIASACSYLFRSLGLVFGISMCATTLNSTLRSTLTAALDGSADAAEIADRVRTDLSYFRGLDPQLKHIVQQCYGQATRAALGVSLALVVGAAVSAWFIHEVYLGTKDERAVREEEA